MQKKIMFKHSSTHRDRVSANAINTEHELSLSTLDLQTRQEERQEEGAFVQDGTKVV